MTEPPGFHSLHGAVVVLTGVASGLDRFVYTADLNDGSALGDQLISGCELAVDLLSKALDAFRSETTANSDRMINVNQLRQMCGAISIDPNTLRQSKKQIGRTSNK